LNFDTFKLLTNTAQQTERPSDSKMIYSAGSSGLLRINRTQTFAETVFLQASTQGLQSAFREIEVKVISQDSVF
jgi:uncharacterized protein YjiK